MRSDRLLTISDKKSFTDYAGRPSQAMRLSCNQMRYSKCKHTALATPSRFRSRAKFFLARYSYTSMSLVDAE